LSILEGVAPEMVAQMAEKPESAGKKRKIGGLKVRPEDVQLVNKIATHRGLSVEKLFMEDDVQKFFKHLLRIEMEKEMARLGAKPKP